MRPDTGHKKRLGRYHVAEYVGSGPCGEIHEATLDGTGRTYALKRFHDHYVSDSLVASGVATAARQYTNLIHPRIARLHAFVTVDEHTLAAVELIDGISLDLLLDANLPLGAWAKLIVQLGRGVGYAHGRGLCHLGISPTNIICDPSGSISVTDFGFLAPGLATRQGLNLGDRLGNLAPEQLEGKRSSPASDVYSMGTIAYRLLTGKMPYGKLSGDDLEEAILNSPIPEADLPKPFQKLVHRALARSPFERFSDAGAMADAMEAALRAVPSPGSLSDIGKFVFEQLGTGAAGEEHIVAGFDDAPTLVPGDPNPVAAYVAAESASKIPIAEIEVSRTRPYPAQIPDEIINEMPISSGTPEVLLGPAGSGPTGNGQLFIGGVPLSKPETGDVSDDSSDNVAEDEFSDEGGPTPDPRSATVEADFEAGGFIAPEPVTKVTEHAILAAEKHAAMAQRATLAVAQRLPLQRAPTEVTPDANAAADKGSADFPSIEDEYSEDSGVRGSAMSEEAAAAEPVRVPQKFEPSPPVIQSHQRQNGSWLKYGLLAVILVSGGVMGYKLLFSKGEVTESMSENRSTDDSQEKDARSGTTVSKPVDAETTNPDKRDAALAVALNLDAAGIATNVTTDAATEVDAREVVAVAPDAAVAVTRVPSLDAGSDIASPSVRDKLEITSAPTGASVYIDGTPVGKTPVSIDASMDRHRLALLLPGYNLHTDDIDGAGSLTIELSEVTPGEGPGGIKVRCRKKNRYYVFVDGRATGELCPSERIGVSKGKHMVEIYDPVSDSRREYKAVVTGTRASLRVRVD